MPLDGFIMKIYRFFAVFMIVTLTLTNGFAISTSVKAGTDYRYTLDVIRKLKIMVENFPNEEKNGHYDKIKTLFQQAGEELYGRDYTASHEKFLTTKKEIIVLLDKISSEYLERSKMILDSTSRNSFNILIDFGKTGPYVSYFIKPFDPLRGVMPYNDKFKPSDYHYFRDKETIERYLQNGYKKYRMALNIFNDQEIKILRSRKRMSSHSMDYIIQSYMNVVFLCREAKQYGIEIHKIMHVHETGDILARYNISGDQMTPIYDDRIPKEYKVDAVDNAQLIYSIEEKRVIKK